MSKPHKHAALMLQYAQDAAETEKPWERWEYKYKGEEWKSSDGHINFYQDFEYRRKPRTININGFEVPEPMRDKPGYGTFYYTFSPVMDGMITLYKFRNDSVDLAILNAGLCHLTRKAAELHAKALLSFTKKEETK